MIGNTGFHEVFIYVAYHKHKTIISMYKLHT